MSTSRQLARAALEVAAGRVRLLSRLRKALVDGNNEAALATARVLTGLDEEDNAESDRADQSFN